MAANISQSPPAKSLHLDPLWLRLNSSLVAVQNSYLRIESAGANNPPEAFTITFGGTSVTFTVSASPDGSGTQLPQRVAQTNEAYAAELAEAISQNETITNTFLVYTSNAGSVWYVWLMAKERSALAITFVEDMNNTTFTDYSSSGIYLADNLRALVEVYTDTGSMATDASLGQQHAPYTASRTALFDLSSHFADLLPNQPPIDTLDGFFVRWEPTLYTAWYFRYADKYGSPAVAEAMKKAAGGTVFFGSHAADALEDYAAKPIKHVTARRDGLLFWKPLGHHQPDWTYFYCEETRTDYNYQLTVYWSDGSSTVYGGSDFALTAGRMFSITTSARQLDIEGKATAAGKEAVRFSFSLIDSADTHYFTRYYRINCECHEWGHILAYTNGVGGIDTVWLDGKKTEQYDSTAEYARRLRTDRWQLYEGDTRSYNHQASPSWKTSTGWHEDTNYLDHLRQLPLSARTWIIDLKERRYLPVHVQPGSIQTHEDDQDLFALELDITAAWIDQNSNL